MATPLVKHQATEELSDMFNILLEQVSDDTETLLILDQIYTDIFGLLMADKPDPDYTADMDKDILRKEIAENIQLLPAAYQELVAADYRQLETFIINKNYVLARQQILFKSELIMSRLSDGREAPTRIQAVLDQLRETTD
jgi:hypothetical protein